ncbi:4-hydroxy-3-methylbut-2-enyl diphosphate reductase [Neoroseomonas oryzicola]|uniref:4-hydroxy-3-methylbut-2-enyl diphosphate reductase n=1 Tax=Neoroseomonas oryzicola TaxID=535904 RepID=UPI001ADF8453|nr:4-hydroxy-3-methylbut-2-enyl diphosphate reductase [Neoroseomonas oryzicola]
MTHLRSDGLADAELSRAAKPSLRVLLASPRGFCAGVERAIAIVEHAIRRHGPGVHVRHEIVHNRHVVDSLARQGAVFVETLDEVPDGRVTIFSAHGVPRDVEQDAQRRGLPVIDATCPLVTRVHVEGRRYAADGRAILLIGHAGHPEVIGTVGQIPGEVHLVADAAAVERLPLPRDRRVAFVTQTTLSVDDTRATIAAIRGRFDDVVGPETRDICYATQNRQAAVRALAAEVELLLVIGAANSSNSNRLREIGEDCGVPTRLIPDASALRAEWFAGIGSVGITAGASAPEHLVQDVAAALSNWAEVSLEEQAGVTEDIRFRLPAGLA